LAELLGVHPGTAVSTLEFSEFTKPEIAGGSAGTDMPNVMLNVGAATVRSAGVMLAVLVAGVDERV